MARICSGEQSTSIASGASLSTGVLLQWTLATLWFPSLEGSPSQMHWVSNTVFPEKNPDQVIAVLTRREVWRTKPSSMSWRSWSLTNNTLTGENVGKSWHVWKFSKNKFYKSSTDWRDKWLPWPQIITTVSSKYCKLFLKCSSNATQMQLKSCSKGELQLNCNLKATQVQLKSCSKERIAPTKLYLWLWWKLVWLTMLAMTVMMIDRTTSTPNQ